MTLRAPPRTLGTALLVILWATLALIGPERLERTPSLCVLQVAGCSSCPGCGMTRGLAHLARLQPIAAYQQHWASIPVALLASLLVLRPSSLRIKSLSARQH
jgi:hypothetical protein